MAHPPDAAAPWPCRRCGAVVGERRPDGGLVLTGGRLLAVFPERALIACDACDARLSWWVSWGSIFTTRGVDEEADMKGSLTETAATLAELTKSLSTIANALANHLMHEHRDEYADYDRYEGVHRYDRRVRDLLAVQIDLDGFAARLLRAAKPGQEASSTP